MSHKFVRGDLVQYGDRYGLIAESFGHTTWLQGPVYRVYFFDVDRDVILDESTMKLAKDKTWRDFESYLLVKCNCGERHVSRPGQHSSWCTVEKMKRGIIRDKDKSSSKSIVE